jgi:hypothetical protein
MTRAWLATSYWAAALCSACSTNSPGVVTGLPPKPSSVVERSGWIVGTWEGVAGYTVIRSARIESVSGDRKPQTTSRQTHETLRRTQTTGGAAVSLEADSPASSRATLARVSAELSGSQFRFQGAPSTTGAQQVFGECDPEEALLRADLADLTIVLPRQLARHAAWSDSVDAETCVSGFPGRSLLRRRFQVDGDTLIAGVPAVLVTRRDSISAGANGILQQHPITLSAVGTAAAHLFVSVESGKILRVQKRLSLRISALTASKSDVFLESSESVIELAANPRAGAALPGRDMTPGLSSPQAQASRHVPVP